jgi:CPA1 family monovalent cation:H+ antiporter
MEMVGPVLYMLGAVLVSAVVAQMFPKVPASLVQIALGVLLAVTPLHLELTLDPEFFLLFFIAPLLYWDAFEADKQALWRQHRTVLAYALGLVLLIVLVVGFFTHFLVPSIPLAAAFALAAALGPTDAVAVTTLSKRVDISKEHKTLLQGECLLNDASGVVSFQFAIAALVTGTFSLLNATVSLVWCFVGGIVLGVVLAFAKGLVVRAVRSLGLEDVTFHVLLQLLTPFAFYLVAEECGVSGILAVVAAGIVDSASDRTMLPSTARLNIVSTSVWTVISFALNGVVFVLLGMLLPSATVRTWASSIPNGMLILYVLAISAVLVLVRFAWCLVAERIRKDENGARHRLCGESVRSAALLTLAGPKGAVTLSICLSIPRFIGTGEVVQSRELLIFLGAGVILVTLLLANFVVPLLAPKKVQQRTKASETAGRIQVLRNTIYELSHDDSLADKKAVRRVVASYEARIERIKGTTDYQDASEDALREQAIGWETLRTNQAIKDGEVAPIVGYGYLIELERRLSRLHHRGELRWFVRNASGWFGAMRRAGFESWGVTAEVRRQRHEARDRLRALCAETVIANLRPLEDDGAYQQQSVTHVILEYQRVLAMARGEFRRSASTTSGQVDAVKRAALQIEREQIRKAYENDLISRETVRTMRDNIAAIEYDLGSD